MQANNVKRICLAFIIFQLFSNTYGQNDCKQLLNEYTNKFAEICSPESDNVYFIDFIIKNEYREKSKVSKQEDHIKIYANKAHFRYISDLVEIYGDDRISITILKNQKVLIIGRTLSDKERNRNFQVMKLLRDTLISISEYKCMQSFDSIRGQIIKNELTIPLSYRKKIEADKIDFYFSEKLNALIKTEVWGSSNSSLIKSTTIFNCVDFDYREIDINVPLNKIFFQKGQIIGKYKGYQLIDNRKNQ